MNSASISRRTLIKTLSAAALTGKMSNAAQVTGSEFGVVVGQVDAEKVGLRILAEGGNAIDAVVAAALTAAIAAPNSTGIGGYGMSATIAHQATKKIISIDGNTTAPMSMPANLFELDESGKLPPGLSQSNSLSSVGWLSAGVPGILAGLQLAIDQFGTRGFDELVQPAISLARNGIRWPQSLASVVERSPLFQTDPGSRRLYKPDGRALVAGELFRNPELAELLAELARANSVASFYRGDIAQRIADGFTKHGGLVTAQDLAAYEAKLVEPLRMEWEDFSIDTAPLTAGGISVLQMLQTLKAMKWTQLPAGLQKTQARIEAMRLAWRDRLTLLGDPAHTQDAGERLLSSEYASLSAERILAAVKSGKKLATQVSSRPQTGTINLCAADRFGNFVALTLTHGNAFGACVTVDGLGLTLGHGMSRFDPAPTHPNAPGPGKRPLHNMVPSIVARDGQPVLAVGGTGGRKIPNALFEVLTQFVALEKPLKDAIGAPRLHTEGNDALAFEKSWPATDLEQLKQLGYNVSTSANANISAIANEQGRLRPARR